MSMTTAEDYQWKDDHLSLDLSRIIRSQHPDPPVEAALEELKASLVEDVE